ncbi:Protein DFG16, partial [Clarias magur]
TITNPADALISRTATAVRVGSRPSLLIREKSKPARPNYSHLLTAANTPAPAHKSQRTP